MEENKEIIEIKDMFVKCNENGDIHVMKMEIYS